MGLGDFFRKINGDPNQALFAALEQLGLGVEAQSGALTELAGTYRGRPAAMVVDGSAIVGAGHRAYASATGIAIAGALGLISPRYQAWSEQWNTFRARTRMQRAQMMLRWAVRTSAPGGAARGAGHDRAARRRRARDDGRRQGQRAEPRDVGGARPGARSRRA